MPNTKYTAAALSKKLEGQLDHYPRVSFQPSALKSASAFKSALKSINGVGAELISKDDIKYLTEHAQLVADYLKKHSNSQTQPTISAEKSENLSPIEKIIRRHPLAVTTDLRNFFRRQFIKRISEIIASGKPAYENKDGGVSRQAHPESATIRLTDFLGKEGVELYHLALQEEMHSPAYRESVLAKSTQFIPGKKWAKRPVIVIAGPSGCGKSTAAEQAIQQADHFLPKVKNDKLGNTIIFVDGGKIREASQIRKLVIQASNANGYSGITDLHDQSNCLDEVKKFVAETAFKHPTCGIVIPETYSKAGVVAGDLVISQFTDLPRIIGLPDSVPIFCHIKGKEPNHFQQAVGFMGSRRAWKTDFSTTTDIDLNIDAKKICESKEYNAQYFTNGLHGSEAAETYYTRYCPNPLKLIIVNDFILLKQDAETGEWGPAAQTDAGAILVSERAFRWWKRLKHATEENKEFGDDIPSQVIQGWKKLAGTFHTPPSLKDFSAVVPLPIRTSNEMKLAQIIARVERHLNKLDAAYKVKLGTNKHDAESYEASDIAPILTILALLKTINTRDNTRVSDAIHSALTQTHELKTAHFNIAPSLLHRLILKLGPTDYYLKQKALTIINEVIAALEIIKVQQHSNAPLVIPNEPTTPITKQATKASPAPAPQVVIESTGLLAKDKRKQIQDFIASKTDWEIVNNETKRIDIRKKDTPAATFKISEQNISTSHKEKSLFKMMLETFLENNKEVKRLHIKAKDAGIKQMMEEVCTEAGLSKENVTIIIPSTLRDGSLFNKTPVSGKSYKAF